MVFSTLSRSPLFMIYSFPCFRSCDILWFKSWFISNCVFSGFRRWKRRTIVGMWFEELVDHYSWRMLSLILIYWLERKHFLHSSFIMLILLSFKPWSDVCCSYVSHCKLFIASLWNFFIMRMIFAKLNHLLE